MLSPGAAACALAALVGGATVRAQAELPPARMVPPRPTAPPATPRPPASIDAMTRTLAADHPEMRDLRDVFDWGQGTYGALATSANSGGGNWLIVSSAGAHQPATSRYASEALLASTVRLAARLDLDEDGSPEVLVWSQTEPLQAFRRDGLRLIELWRPAWMLAEARDLEQARALVSRLRGYNAPAAGVTPLQVLLSMQFATEQEFTALLTPRGVRVCDVATGNAHPHYRRCRVVATARFTQAMLFGRLTANSAFADYDGRPVTVPGLTNVGDLPSRPTCRAVQGGSECSANMGGPGNYVWRFSGEGASLRFSEFRSEVYEDS